MVTQIKNPRKEVAIIRDLARRVAEIAAEPVQQQKAEMWRDHNDLRPHRPMVLIFPEGSWDEIQESWTWQCETPLCRALETELRTKIYCWENLRDDNVIEPRIDSPIVVHHSGIGIEAARTLAEGQKGAYHIDPVLVEDDDLDKIRMPEITVDWDETRRIRTEREEILDGILNVEAMTGMAGHMAWTPMDTLATLRGIGQLMMDLVLKPDWVHAAMQKLLDIRLHEIKCLEEQGALTLNNRSHYNGSGGVGYTRQLPQPDFDGQHVRLQDIWGMATAQIFSEVSPDMHEEFALQYERQFLERFGLSNYGCCEPLHLKFDSVMKIRNLRRISISPWADVEKSAERLKRDFVFSWKPNPAPLAATTWQPDAIRRELLDFCEKTRGCVTDIIMKDTHTCLGHPERLTEWVQIATQVAHEFPV